MTQYTQIFLTNHTCSCIQTITIVQLHNFTPTLTCPKLHTYTLHMMCIYIFEIYLHFYSFDISKNRIHTQHWHIPNIIISGPLTLPGCYWSYPAGMFCNRSTQMRMVIRGWNLYTGPELITLFVGRRGISTGPKWW
jgi:hypothetical protein